MNLRSLKILSPLEQVRRVRMAIRKNPALARKVLDAAGKYGKYAPAPYGPAIQMAAKVVSKAQAGDKGALAKIAAAQAGAKAGDPQAIASLQLLQAGQIALNSEDAA